MDNVSKENSELNKKIEKIEKQIQPALYEQNLDMTKVNEEAEKDLNSKILEITLKIKDKYPELSKYLDEMTVTIPDEKKPEITLENLKIYYDSLDALLRKYILEHPTQ
ncbi:MAG: hypothetical protein V4547_12335 [Bacteroidota bacterium]